MKERALQFGPDRRLIGILSLPERVDRTRPAILVPNTGVEHRVGPNRLHVKLCRAFAERGFVALRLDLSGMGDSGLPADGGRGDPRDDLECAMERLERMNLATRFAVVGLCSGGNEAHRLARVDERVVAAAFVDHYQYRTTRAWLIGLAQKLAEPRRALNFLRRKWHAIAGHPRSEYDPELVSFFEQPRRAEFIDDVRGFMARGMALFFLYTGENQSDYNYAGQLHDVVPALRGYPLHALHYVPSCDHTFTHERMRDELIALLARWLESQVLAAPSRAIATAAEDPPCGFTEMATDSGRMPLA